MRIEMARGVRLDGEGLAFGALKQIGTKFFIDTFEVDSKTINYWTKFYDRSGVEIFSGDHVQYNGGIHEVLPYGYGYIVNNVGIEMYPKTNRCIDDMKVISDP